MTSGATIRGIPPGGTARQRIKRSDAGEGIEWVNAGDDEWDDIIVPGTSVRTTGTTPPDIEQFNGSTIYLPAFAGGGPSTEQAFFSCELPHDWKEGSVIRPHIHWSPSTAGAGNVKWYLDLQMSPARGEDFSATFTRSAVDVTRTKAGTHEIIETTELVDMPLAKIGAMLIGRIYRVPTDDTYADDAFLLSIGFHYQMDTHGSRQVFIK